MNTKNYKLHIAYDGTDYAGWQYQPDEIAVTNVLQDTFEQVFNEQIKIVGASRTDAGVHALGQVASFSSNLSIPAAQLLPAWSNRLSTDIMVKSLEVASTNFYPMRNVKQKIYWYHIFPERPLPFVQRYGYWMRFPFDPIKLEKGLQLFIGTHDFKSFTSDDTREITERHIDLISLHYLKRLNVYRVEFRAVGFLRYMIRRIVGACLEVASRPQLKVDLLSEILAARNPEHTLPNAPAKGLLLYKVLYKEAE